MASWGTARNLNGFQNASKTNVRLRSSIVLRQSRMVAVVTKRAFKPFAGLALLLAFVLIAWDLAHQKPEPVWSGKPLSAWTEELATGSSKEIREAAEDAIRHIGAAGIPALLQMLRSRDTILHPVMVRIVRELNRKQNKAVFRILSARDQHLNAALAFEALGSIARPAIPLLKDMLIRARDPEFAADALAGIGPEGVAAILEVLPKVAPERRCTLFYSAAKWPSQALAITAVLLRSIKSPNAEERRCAAEFLGRFKQHPATSVPLLVSALRDPDPKVRLQALSTLAEFGTNATAAIRPITELAQNKSWLSPEAVSNALARLQPAN